MPWLVEAKFATAGKLERRHQAVARAVVSGASSPDFSPDFVAFIGRSEGRGFNPAEDAAANSLFVSRPEQLERTNCSGRETRG